MEMTVYGGGDLMTGQRAKKMLSKTFRDHLGREGERLNLAMVFRLLVELPVRVLEPAHEIEIYGD